MIRLEPAAVESVAALSLWDGLEIHLAVASVLAGNTPGSVYVDDPGRPGRALLQAGNRFHLAGPPTGEAWPARLRFFFLAEAHRPNPTPQGQGTGGFSVYYPGAEWQPAVEEMLAGTGHAAAQRLYLELDAGSAARLPALPPGFRLRQVDEKLLAEETLGGLAELRQEMTSECPSVEFFLARRFGICLEAKGRLAGWCLSEYDAGERCEVGIETAAEHRRRGLGTAMALALAAQARSRGITRLGWHSYEGNQASVATALRAGFRPVVSYPAHSVRRSRHDWRGET